MVFDARAVAADAEAKYQPFTFIGLDGEEYSLPSPMLISGDAARKLNIAFQESSEEALFKQLKRLWPEDAFDAVMEMPAAALGQLMDAWKAGIDEQGKELSPSEPRNRAERRSKPTSSSAGSKHKKKKKR